MQNILCLSTVFVESIILSIFWMYVTKLLNHNAIYFDEKKLAAALIHLKIHLISEWHPKHFQSPKQISMLNFENTNAH